MTQTQTEDYRLPRTGSESLIEEALLEALEEAGKSCGVGQVPAIEMVTIVLRSGSTLPGTVKPTSRPRIYIVGQPMVVPDGRGGQRRVDDHIVEAVFHGEDLLCFAMPRKVPPQVIQVQRSGEIILPT